MAVTIVHKAEDTSAQSQGNILTVDRVMIVNGSNMAEIATSPLIPQAASRHPANSTLMLKSRDFEPVGNIGREVQARITMTYSNEGMSNRDMMGNDGSKDPWELAAQNVQVSYSTENVPLLFGYKGDGTMIQLLNSAGSRLLIEGQRIIRQISFSYCVKAGRTGEAPINDRVIINAKTEKTAGYTFKPFTAMLMPMNATFVQDVDDNGDIYRRYWQIEAVIMENASTWVRRALDVGTKALFGDKKIPQPIYQYYEWTNPDANANFEVPPSFGSISDVERAKMHFADIGGGVRSNSEDWNKRYDMVPYNEMTEPLPLNNGKIYLDAIKDPEKYPYKTINYFENKPGSWAKWNLPKGRA